MAKSRLFLILAFASGGTVFFCVAFSKTYPGIVHLVIFPAIIGCIAFLGLYAKRTRHP
jgi:hypothetical protein